MAKNFYRDAYFAPKRSYDEIPPNDPAALREAREGAIREVQVQCQIMKIYLEKLEFCVAKEGVNYRQNCRELAAKYMAQFKYVNELRTKDYYKYRVAVKKPEDI